ncbi:MAG: hypothetical protein WA461_01870, partial [Nitrososphaeraceae archaeon]
TISLIVSGSIEANALERINNSRSYCNIRVIIAPNNLPGRRTFRISFEFVQKKGLSLASTELNPSTWNLYYLWNLYMDKMYLNVNNSHFRIDPFCYE